MQSKPTLEKVIDQKVKPIIDDAMHRFLGVSINEIATDISDRLKKNPLFDLDIDTSMSYRQAKKLFRRHYLDRLLKTQYGSITRVAAISGLNRRTIHRLIKSLQIGIEKFREELPKQYQIRHDAVKNVIDSTLGTYKAIIRPEKLEEAYKQTSILTKDILKELPLHAPSLKDAGMEFEKKFFSKLKEEEKNISKLAKRLGLRYETLHRKLKILGI